MADRFTFINADYMDHRIKDGITVSTNSSVNTWNTPITERNNASVLSQLNYIPALQLHFIAPVELNVFTLGNADNIEQRINDKLPINTRRNTNWAVNAWNTWITVRNNARILGQPKFPNAVQLQFIAPVELNEYLCYFVLEVRNQQGKLYPKDSLYNLMCGLARYLKEVLQRPDLNFMNSNNVHFSRFRQTLDSQMKLAKEEGVTTVQKQAKPISPEQEEALWEKGILNCCTALGLSKAVYFYNCKVFGLRSRYEHRSLKVEQYSFSSDDSGKYVKFNGHACKHVVDGLAQQQTVRLKEIKQYDTDKEICVYRIFKTYIEYIGNRGHFYRRPLSPRYEGEIQFGEQTLGLGVLGSYMKNIMQEAGFSGYFTSHSGVVTLATALFDHGVDEKLIKERTGHSLNTVRRYKRTSSSRKKVMSEMVDIQAGNESDKEIKPVPVIEESFLPPRKRRALREYDTAGHRLSDDEDKALTN